MTHTEALRMALELLAVATYHSPDLQAKRTEVIDAGLKALAQSQQEPLSELEKDAVNLLFALHDAWPYVHRHCTIESNRKAIQALIIKHGDFADLHPPEPKRKPLTDEEIIGWVESGEYNVITNDWASHIEFARAIEAKLKEKNT